MTYQHYHSDPSGWRDDCEGCQAEAHPPRAEAHADTARPSSEFAWLIERGQPEGLDHAEWWTGLRWGTDAFAAIRFATQDEAERAIGKLNADKPYTGFEARAVQHGFATSQPGPISPARPVEPPHDTYVCADCGARGKIDAASQDAHIARLTEANAALRSAADVVLHIPWDDPALGPARDNLAAALASQPDIAARPDDEPTQYGLPGTPEMAAYLHTGIMPGHNHQPPIGPTRVLVPTYPTYREACPAGCDFAAGAPEEPKEDESARPMPRMRQVRLSGVPCRPTAHPDWPRHQEAQGRLHSRPQPRNR